MVGSFCVVLRFWSLPSHETLPSGRAKDTGNTIHSAHTAARVPALHMCMHPIQGFCCSYIIMIPTRCKLSVPSHYVNIVFISVLVCVTIHFVVWFQIAKFKKGGLCNFVHNSTNTILLSSLSNQIVLFWCDSSRLVLLPSGVKFCFFVSFRIKTHTHTRIHTNSRSALLLVQWRTEQSAKNRTFQLHSAVVPPGLMGSIGQKHVSC